MHNRRFISINRVATLLEIHHRTARRMLESLQLQSVRIGQRTMYRTSDVARELKDILATPVSA